MLSETQMKQVEASYKHGDALVVRIDGRVYVTEDFKKDPKAGTIKLKNCQEVDETCFSENGEEYYGDVTGENYNFTLKDSYADNENVVATIYYAKDIISVTTTL